MTIQEMVTNLQDYYTLRYTSKIQVDMIAQYVENVGIDPGVLFEQIVLAFKGQYGKLPDVAAIKEIIEASPESKRMLRLYQDENDRVWSRGRRIGHVDAGKFIPLYFDGVPSDVRKLDHTSPEKFIEFMETKIAIVGKAEEGSTEHTGEGV